MTNLALTRLVYVAPASGTTGVGDYADDFVAAVTPHFADVVQLRHGGPGQASAGDVRSYRRELLRVIDASEVPVIVHAEHSGGSLEPFWGSSAVRGVPVSATVHDPPWSVWYPFRTRTVARSSLVTHGIHRTLIAGTHAIERRANRGVQLFALTSAGAAALEANMGYPVHEARLPVPERPELRPAQDRPLAIGLFGHVYRAKGFDQLAQLRAATDPEIAIRVAGRGTQDLPAIDGVELVGEVNGPEEDAFFDSIRLLAMPYLPRVIYGITALPAAATATRAIAYQTPIAALAGGIAAHLAGRGAEFVTGDAADLGRRASAIAKDRTVLAKLHSETLTARELWRPEKIVQVYLDTWRSRP